MVLVSFSTSDSVRFSCSVPLLLSAIFLLRVSDCSLPSDLSDICLDFSEIGLLGHSFLKSEATRRLDSTKSENFGKLRFVASHESKSTISFKATTNFVLEELVKSNMQDITVMKCTIIYIKIRKIGGALGTK